MILADHCVYGNTLRFLRGAGYDVRRSRDLIRSDAPDAEVLKAAIDNDLVLLTNDRDFSNTLVYPPAGHAGVIVLRITAATENEVHEVLLRLLTSESRESLRARLAVVSAKKYRLRS